MCDLDSKSALLLGLLVLLTAPASGILAQEQEGPNDARAQTKMVESISDFIRPARAGDKLIYGVKDGIRIAFHPDALDGRNQGGPRGLIRVGYAQGEKHFLINYVAVEPLANGSLGYSELEQGGDGAPGKRFWIGATKGDGGIGVAGDVSGRIEMSDMGPMLSFVVFVEPFNNGASVMIEVSLFQNHPNQVRFRTCAAKNSATISRCTLSATMGNQSRCRILWLGNKAISSKELYLGYHGSDFIEKRPFRLNDLFRTDSGEVLAAISPDEFEPSEAWPLPNDAWHHDGKWMTQFWLKRRETIDESLECRVNGRYAYWGGDTPIPGGVSFENFEFRETFRDGQEVWFGYLTESPRKQFGFSYDAVPQNGTRVVAKSELVHIAAAEKESASLRNGDFRTDKEGWQLEGGASAFRIFDSHGVPALTSFGSGKDADSGRAYQCFRVPANAHALRFQLHGGGTPKTFVALWSGTKLCRKMCARDNNTPFRVAWDIREFRGQVVTLEIVDKSTDPWGFIGVQEFAISSEESHP